jgi:hypothetical protein
MSRHSAGLGSRKASNSPDWTNVRLPSIISEYLSNVTACGTPPDRVAVACAAVAGLLAVAPAEPPAVVVGLLAVALAEPPTVVAGLLAVAPAEPPAVVAAAAALGAWLAASAGVPAASAAPTVIAVAPAIRPRVRRRHRRPCREHI